MLTPLLQLLWHCQFTRMSGLLSSPQESILTFIQSYTTSANTDRRAVAKACAQECADWSARVRNSGPDTGREGELLSNSFFVEHISDHKGCGAAMYVVGDGASNCAIYGTQVGQWQPSFEPTATTLVIGTCEQFDANKIRMYLKRMQSRLMYTAQRSGGQGCYSPSNFSP
jgi:hypothetical protein